MFKLGTLHIEQATRIPREDGTYTVLPGVYEVQFTPNSDGVGGYMCELMAINPENHKAIVVMGGGWFSQGSVEVPNFGLGRFDCSDPDHLPQVGTKGTQLVSKLSDLN
jgi:hypothetical protein